MTNKVLAAIERYNMFAIGDTVVVGVSGGADSMCLLHVLQTLSKEFSLHVIAAHFNHGIRGEQADADEQFVRFYCAENGIQFISTKIDIPSKAKEMHVGIEECSRILRYSFLQGVAENAKIATAHTLSDATETFLLNFVRGTGIAGLCGIPAVRECIVRPLIFCTADETRTYCKVHQIPWREDASNADVTYSRNRIRLQVSPALKQINSSYEENAMRCMQLLHDDHLFLKQLAEQAFEDCMQPDGSLSLVKLASFSSAIATRVLISYVESLGVADVSYKQIAKLRNLKENDCITLHGGQIFIRCGDTLSLKNNYSESPDISVPISEECSEYLFFDDVVSVHRKSFDRNDMKQYVNIADADKVKSPILRNRRAGDTLRLRRRKCTKSFKQLCNEKKIPVRQRNLVPIVSDENGIVWVAGFGVDESRLPDEYTENIIIFEWRKNVW